MNLVVNARDAMAEGGARVNLDEDAVRNTLRFVPADIWCLRSVTQGLASTLISLVSILKWC